VLVVVVDALIVCLLYTEPGHCSICTRLWYFAIRR